MTMNKTLTLIAALSLAVSAFAQPASFSPRGAGGGGALFASSINGSEIYIACDMSEVFHSTDFGESWSFPDFRQLQSYKISAVSFGGNGVRYAIDGSSTPDGVDRSRPMKSFDLGKTWTPITDPTSGSAYSIFAYPSNFNGPNTILISDYNTLYASIDGGVSFTQKYNTNNNSAGLHIAGVFFYGDNVYVGTNEGVLVSMDGGKTFTKANLTGIPSTEFIVSFCGAAEGGSIKFFCVTNSQVYAGITGADKDSYKGIYSMDWGTGSWKQKTTGIPAGTYPFFCAMSSGNINTAYVAGGSNTSAPIVYKTTDGGTTWQSVFNTSNNQNIATGWSGDGGDRFWSYGEYALGFAVAPNNPNYCVIADLGFAHITSDGGATWKQVYVADANQHPAGAKTPTAKTYHSVGLENTTCWQVSWIDKDNMYGCYSDIKGVRSTDAGNSWGFNYTGHNDNSMYYLVKNTASATVYASTSSVHDMYQSTTLTDARIDGGKGKVLFSTNNGAAWQTMHDFAHPVIWLATDPTNTNRLYASVISSTVGGIYVSNDIQNGATSTWTKLTNPPRTEGHPFNIRVLNDGSLVASYSGRRTTNFTASSGVFYSTDGGTSWEDRSDANMQYWTKDVVIDPHDATQNTWYAGVFSGWGGAANNKGGLYKTTNRGQNWTKVSSELRVTSCSFDPRDAEKMYFTTEVNGLFYSSNRRNANPTFTQVASYPFRQPERVFFNPFDTTEIWVSSFGNGMRMGKTSAVATAPGPFTLLSPPNGTQDVKIPVVLQWQPAIAAEKYEVEVATTQDFLSRYFDSTTVVTTTLPLHVDSGMTYYWRVKASNSFGDSYSPDWRFSIEGKNSVFSEKQNISSIHINPNPAHSKIDVSVTLQSPEDISLSIVGEDGRVIRVVGNLPNTEKQTISVDCTNLASGTYYMVVRGKRTSGMEKVSIVH